MRPETALSRWLVDELPRRGYPLGPRAGGIARFAADAGLSPATASRTVNGKQEPSTDTLRKIGKLWGIPFTEMLVLAGQAVDHGHRVSVSDGVPRIGADDWWVTTPPDDLWLGVIWEELALQQRWIWHTPNTTPETRYRMAAMVQWEREADIAAERYGRELDVRADRQQDRGANGA